MKIKVLENAYYNETYYKAGQVININAKEVPSWAELIEEKKASVETEENNGDKEQKGQNITVGADEEKQKQYLEELLNEAFEKEIFIEDADKKTVAEQIEELEELLKG